MKPLKEVFESGQPTLWIETQNTVAFLRPVPDVPVGTPCPTACPAESLRLRQVGLTIPEGLLSRLALGDVSHRPDKPAVAGCILRYMSQGVDVFDSPIRQQQPILVFEVCAGLGRAINHLLCERPVV